MIDLRVRRSREGLRAALLDLLESKAFEDITIREVAARAGVGYTTFFRHYPGKEALLDDVAADEIRSLTEHAMPIYDSGDPASACLALCSYVERHRALWSALLTGGAAATLKQEFTDQARRLAEEQPAGGRVIPDELRVIFSVSATVEILAWWLQQQEPYDVNRMAEILDRLVVRPAIAP
jgi:AcrR family transcriptional regulator